METNVRTKLRESQTEPAIAPNGSTEVILKGAMYTGVPGSLRKDSEVIRAMLSQWCFFLVEQVTVSCDVLR